MLCTQCPRQLFGAGQAGHCLLHEGIVQRACHSEHDVCTDTDFAGCKTTRRSMSGGTVMFGTHCVRHWATTQTTLSLSSGEAELHGIGKGISHALGLKSLYADLGKRVDLRIHSDATTAIGTARRRGLGKLRHLDCEDLWIQANVRNEEVKLVKVLGT